MSHAPRTCSGCGEALAQRPAEDVKSFQRRRTCGSRECISAAKRKGSFGVRDAPPRERSREKAWLDRLAMVEEARGTMEFEKSELVRAARRAAPTVPARVLADVLREVEPLIAANVRSAVLAAFADAARPFLPSWVPPEERMGEKVS
jgi:hypothetical protein